MADEPIEGLPILFSPETYSRHENALSYISGDYRTRAPRPGRGRFPRLTPGAWGLLAAGATITGASGLSLGSGTVKLCARDGTVYDADETVDVANAGTDISGGDAGMVLPMEWTSGEWTVCGCGSPPIECPCVIPLTDHTLYNLDGTVYKVLNYDDTGYLQGYSPGIRWYTDCFDFHGDATDSSIVTARERLTFGCIPGANPGGAFFLQTEFFYVPGTGGGDSTPRECTPDFPYPGIGLAFSEAPGFPAYCCDPFFVEIGDDTSGEYNGYIGTPSYRFHVEGAGGFTWSGITVDVWTSDAKTTHIGSAMTDASGNCMITGIWAHADYSEFVGPSPYYEVSDVPDRYAVASGTLVGPCRGVTSVVLTAADGYVFMPTGCTYPIATTLHISHPVFGPVTLNRAGSLWTGTKSYSYPGYGACPAVTATIYFTWDGGSLYAEQWARDDTDCPPGGDITSDPFTGDQGPSMTATWTAGAVTCYVPSSTALDVAFTFDPSSDARYTNMYQGTDPLTLHITE
jgi:hypothetical protein